LKRIFDRPAAGGNKYTGVVIEAVVEALIEDQSMSAFAEWREGIPGSNSNGISCVDDQSSSYTSGQALSRDAAQSPQLFTITV
jgi:hypothetical protein